MDIEKSFFKFVSGESCSYKDFELARKYCSNASIHIKKQFYTKLFFIIYLCIEQLLKDKTTDLLSVRPIYSKWGIYDGYFKAFFSLYLKKFNHDPHVLQYMDLANQKEDICYEPLFEQAKEKLWYESEMQKLALMYHMNYEQLRGYLNDYAFSKYHLTSDEFKKYKAIYRNFYHFLQGQKLPLKSKKSTYLYLKKYATLTEKERFKQFAHRILLQVQEAILENRSIDDLLKNAFLTDYDLYQFLQYDSFDPKVVEVIIKRFKKYYDIGLSHSFLLNQLKDFAYQYDMDVHDFVFLAKCYAKEILKINNIDDFIASQRINKIYTKPVYSALSKLCSENDYERIAEIFYQEKVTVNDICNYCYCMRSDLSKENQQKLEQKFLCCLDKVKARRMKEYLQNRAVSQPNYSVFYEYLNQDSNFKDFCTLKSISITNFRERAYSIKDPLLAKQVLEKMQKDVQDNKDMKTCLCKDLISQIKNGITINQVHRNFNLFDYFYYFGEYKIHQFMFHSLSLSPSEQTLLKKFFAPLRCANRMNPDVVVHSVYEFHSKKDKNGYPIKGTGIIVSESELEEIVLLFNNKNIPLYDVVINMAIRCYVNGTLISKNALQRSHFN